MRLKTLNGAPIRSQLAFDEADLLHVTECKNFEEITGCSFVEASTVPDSKWRRISRHDARLRTGWSQPYLPQPRTIQLRSNENDASAIVPDTTLEINQSHSNNDDFLEQSIIFHDNLLSSQMIPDVSEWVDDATVSTSSFVTASFDTTLSNVANNPTENQDLPIIPVPQTIAITSLGSIPSAQHLRSIYPQTPTSNFVCVLTSSPQQREVVVRKSGIRMKLWELTVADDTRAEFTVSIWVQPPNSKKPMVEEDMVLETLEHMRTGDVILMRNIALTSFRDVVYGQSLRPSIVRARTSIDILMKHTGALLTRIDTLPKAVIEAFMRMKTWTRTHLAVDPTRTRKRLLDSPDHKLRTKRHSRGQQEYNDHFPPDTLEAV